MKVRLLGAHNLESRNTRHTCLLVDGVLALDAGSLVSALGLTELRVVRALLLTHRHFDHIRDVPTLGLATLEGPFPIDIYSLPETLATLRLHLLNGTVYPDLTKELADAPARYSLHSVNPEVPFTVLGYQVRAVPTPHGPPSVGYIVKSDSGGCIAYTGDTGGNLLPFFQDAFAPRTLFVEVTFPNRLESIAKLTGHLTPHLLYYELLKPAKMKLPTPKIVAVHLSLQHQQEVAEELSGVARSLGIEIAVGYQDMMLESG